MKKVSLLLGTLLFAGTTMVAQNQVTKNSNIEEDYLYEAVGVSEAGKNAYKNTGGSLAAPGQIIISEDFGGGTLPAGWTAQTNSTHSGGWMWTNQMSQGQYATGTTTIQSTTASNGFLILDADAMNPGSSANFSDVDAYIEIPLPSLASIGALSIKFEHYWRPFAFSAGGGMWILTSRNNGSTWDTLDVSHGVPTNVSSSAHFFGAGNGGRPWIEELSLTKQLGNATQPKLRIHWSGNSHYFWQIDDLEIREGYNNEINPINTFVVAIDDTVKYNYEDWYAGIPLKQANAYNTIVPSAIYENVGQATQTGVQVNVASQGPNGWSMNRTSAPKVLSVGATDSATVTGGGFALNGGVGEYSFNFYMTSDSTLHRTGRDTTGYSPVFVTDTVYGRDRANPAGGSVVYYQPSAVFQYEVGVLYEIREMDTASSVSFYVDDANLRRPNKDGLFQAAIYRASDYNSGGIPSLGTQPILQSSKVKITDLNIPATGGWVTLSVSSTTPGELDTLSPGSYVVSYIADQFFGQDTLFLSLEGRDGWQSHYFLRQDQGGTWGNWGYSQNKTFVRLNTKPVTCPVFDGSVSSQSTTACGASDGEAEVTDPTTGVGPYSYSWDAPGNPTTKKVTGLASGVYNVTITDTKGCTQIASATVSDFGAPVVTNENVTDVNCAGNGEGQVSFNLTAGTSGPGYMFTWFDANGDTVKVGGGATKADSTLSGVEAGMYSVEIVDAGACKQSKQYMVNGPTDPLAIGTVQEDDAACKGDANGSIEIQGISGGTGNYSLAWSNGDTTTTITGLTAGSYSVTVTDANNCTTTGSYTVGEPTTALQINPVGLGGQNTKIDSSSQTFVEVTPNSSGGNGSFQYTWKNSAGQTCQVGTNGELKVGPGQGANQSGCDDYTATVTDAKGCTANETFNVCASFIGQTSVQNQFGRNFEMKLFPNPNNGSFNIQMLNADNNVYTFEVKNMLGQIVFQNEETINGDYFKTVELNDSKVGVYFLTISNGEGSASYKIVVE